MKVNRLLYYLVRPHKVARRMSYTAEKLLLERLLSSKRYQGNDPQPILKAAFELTRKVRGIEDKEGAHRYLPERWRLIFNEIAGHTRQHIDYRQPFTFLNFGAGDKNPLALSMLLMLAGAGEVLTLEPMEIDEDTTRICLIETILDVLARHEQYAFPSRPDILARLDHAVNMRALIRGEPLAEILGGKHLSLLKAPGEELPIADRSIDLIYSRSVLEHIVNYRDVISNLVRILSPGGIMFHDIDLGAHNREDQCSFYYVEEFMKDGRFDNLNRLRKSDYLSLFESSDCSVEIVGERLFDEAQIDFGRIVPALKNYSRDDLRVAGLRILVRRKH